MSLLGLWFIWGLATFSIIFNKEGFFIMWILSGRKVGLTIKWQWWLLGFTHADIDLLLLCEWLTFLYTGIHFNIWRIQKWHSRCHLITSWLFYSLISLLSVLFEYFSEILYDVIDCWSQIVIVFGEQIEVAFIANFLLNSQ